MNNFIQWQGSQKRKPRGLYYDFKATYLQSRKKKKCKSEVKIMGKNMLDLDNGLLKVEEIAKNIIMQQESKINDKLTK